MKTLIVLFIVALSPALHAAELTHTLREGETLQQVARYYYGASWKSSYIVGRNGLSSEADAKAGKTYFIPASWIYKIRKNDSFTSIAKKELADKERYRFIMQTNGLTDNNVEIGHELLMPFVIKHTVAANESLSAIAKLYYHSTKQMKALQEYNDLASSSVTLGTKLLIPIADKDTLDIKKKAPMPSGAATTAAPEEPDEKKPVEPALAAVPVAEDEKSPAARIRLATKEYDAGEFDEACRVFERLSGDPKLSRDEKVVVIQHCGYCSIALDQPGPALDYFVTWLEMKPNVQLDPVFVSPKIRNAVDEARKVLARRKAREVPPEQQAATE